MTNIGAIAGVSNLGPVSGDLAGSVAATILGQNGDGSDITGGTGKFKNATGYLDYFGMADFHQNTLVLRYRGVVCYAR
jgi:hypothetical protein